MRNSNTGKVKRRLIQAIGPMGGSKRGAPDCIRMDNGPELIANATRDWCRLSGTGTI